MNIKFSKMHGLGNDFILIDCIDQMCPHDTEKFSALSKRLCDRRFGIGADQLLLLYPSKIADFRMRIFNADGSEVEMCGNGVRCLAKYIWDRNLSVKDVLEIETLAGTIKPERSGDMIRVDMGAPVFEPEKIPVRISQGAAVNNHMPPLGKERRGGVIDYPLQIEDREFLITCVSMGNPHAIIFVDDVSHFAVTYYGPMIETHSIFPGRTNVEFIEVLNRAEIEMRVWERGSGETMACGTGASAAAVAAHMKGLTDSTVKIHLLGGDLLIDWAADNHVYMTGPAVAVFEGMFHFS